MDQVHGGTVHVFTRFIKWIPSIRRSATYIKKDEGVSQLLILSVQIETNS
jgi:hypothetical protein